ncbi:unnamed protein product [Lathyrus oleraceus]
MLIFKPLLVTIFKKQAREKRSKLNGEHHVYIQKGNNFVLLLGLTRLKQKTAMLLHIKSQEDQVKKSQ